MSTTPHPEVSPDGRFYWDGERWVPVALMDEEGFARHATPATAAAPGDHG